MLPNNINILSIEKEIYSEFQSNFNQFLNSLKNSKKISKENSNHIILLNKKMNEINSILIDLKFTLPNKIKKNKKKNKKILSEVKEYESNEQIIRTLLPYMIYLKTLK